MRFVFRTLLIFLMINFILSTFVLAQELPKIEAPENLEEAKEMGERALKEAGKQLPGILEKVWKEEVLPIWQKMWEWFKNNIWLKIEALFQKEAQKRKPIIEEEFQKEKEELKEELPGTTKSLWEKIKELIK